MRNKHFLNFEEYEAKLCELSKRPKISVSGFGKSIMDRNLQKVEIGEGEKKILLLGGVCGDSSEPFSLLTFAEEYLNMCEEGRRMCGTNPRYVSAYRRMIIYPLLNPDAFVYHTEGVCDENPIKERLIGMNGGDNDFSGWKANGRGVSLERNSSIGFEYRKRYENANGIFNGSPDKFSGNTPESEPELCALFDDILKYEGIKVCIQISSGKDEMYSPEVCESIPGGARIRKSVQRISGLKICRGGENDCGIVDSIASKFGIVALKLMPSRVELKYLRDLLYSLPILV